MDKTNKITGTWGWILRTLFALSVVFTLFFTYQSKLRFDSFSWQFITHPAFYISISLVFINYLFEYKKWQLVLNTLNINNRKSTTVQSFFAGIITGLLTPNMQGNFLGRIYYFDRKQRVSITLLTLLGNFAALWITIGFGLIGAYFFVIDDINPSLVNSLGLTFLVFSLLFYFTFERWNIYPRKWKWLLRLKNILQENPKFRIKTAVWTIARYIVFSTQYVLLLTACGLSFDIHLVYAVFTIYFISTLIPSVFLGKIGVRESVSLLVLASFTTNASLILTASLLIWFINLVLPALCGLIICKTK